MARRYDEAIFFLGDGFTTFAMTLKDQFTVINNGW